MKAESPTVPGLVALLLGLLLHPALPLPHGDAWRTAVAFLALALIVALVAASRTLDERLVAAGAALVLLGAAYDEARGHRGNLVLEPGRPVHLFEEEGVRGPLGLRPLGFEARLAGLDEGGVLLVGPRGTVRITPEQGWSWGGMRLGGPSTLKTGEASRVRLAVTRAGVTREVDLNPPEVARLDDLEIALERYFPDFALDRKGEPYTRSLELRNPAALLHVRHAANVFPVFVIQALPGIHNPEGLSASFALLGVEAAVAVKLHVFGEPLAALCLGGLLLSVLGIGMGLRR